jgi:hypothetical protein
MATKITDTEMSSDQTRHTASVVPGAVIEGGPTAWSVSWLPGRLLLRNQAITAMTLAEVISTRADDLADNASRLWLHVDGWAAELGLTGPHAVAEASTSPEDHADMPRVVTTAFDARPGRSGYLLELDKSTGMARVRIDGETITMFAAHLQYAGAPCSLCQLRAARGLEAPPGGCSCQAGAHEEDDLEAYWTPDEDGAHWRTQLRDGRTAVIERLAEGDEGTQFLPKVHESRGDFETGPACASLLDAAAWVAELVGRGPAFAAELAARVEATK